MAAGTSCSRSARRCAVTTTSSSESLGLSAAEGCMASRLPDTNAVQINFIIVPANSLLEWSASTDDAGIHLTPVAHAGLSVVAKKSNDARHVAAYRRHAVQGPAATEKQQCSCLNFDRSHRLGTTIERGGHRGVVLLAVFSDIGGEVEGSAGLRGLQQDRDHEVVEIEMPAVRVAFVHDGRCASHDGIGQLEKRGLIEQLRYAPRKNFTAIQRPQLAPFAQYIGCNDKLTALVPATSYVIRRVLLQCRFIVGTEGLFAPVGARY